MKRELTDCSLCSESLAPIVSQNTLWRVVVNRNQNLLGKCFVATRRHVESVTDLTADEWTDLRDQVGRVTAAIRDTTRPDHFNYAFLMNQDTHVHLHVIPRYAGPREMFGETFDDLGFPDHYVVERDARRLAPKSLDKLAATLAEAVDFNSTRRT